MIVLKQHSKLLVLVLLFLSTAGWAEIYIQVTGANVKRAKLALGQVHLLPDAGVAPDLELAKRVHEQVKDDLEFMNLFDMVNPEFYANYDTAKEVRNIRYEDWSQLGVSFVLKLGYKQQSGRLFLEAFFHDVSGRKKIFSTRYQYPAAQYYRLVHALSEDILKAMTGERGLFNTRILMACSDLKRRRSPPRDIYIVDPDGRNLKQLTSDETISLSPSWAPGGKLITYTQFEFRRSGKIRRKVLALKKHDLTTGNRMVLSAKDGMNSGAAWSPDGRRIAATLSYSGRPEIYLLDPNSPGEPEHFSRKIQWRKTSGEGFQASSIALLFDVEPSWSPDGKKMVISSRRTGHPMIYTVDLATMSATQLTFAGQYNSSPAWSPKGDKIVFAAQRLAEGNFDLYMIDPDGNNLTRLTIGDRVGRRQVNSENPSWAPTGRHLAYASNEDGTYGIWVMAVDGAGKRKISPPDKDCKTPSWGPVLD